MTPTAVSQKYQHVLLARPSMFIVNQMRPFMEVCGYKPHPLKDLNRLDNISDSLLAGAVISTAINSDVPEDYEEVALSLRNQYPNIPIALATLVDFDNLKKALHIKLTEKHQLAEEFIDMGSVSPSTIFKPEKQMLVIHKKHIETDEGRRRSKLILQNFFR